MTYETYMVTKNESGEWTGQIVKSGEIDPVSGLPVFFWHCIGPRLSGGMRWHVSGKASTRRHAEERVNEALTMVTGTGATF
jgi:hypothetical protein